MTQFLLALFVPAQLRAVRFGDRLHQRRCERRAGTRSLATDQQAGQATAEYALVLLGVAAIALLLAAWAAKSGKVGQLFDAVVDQLIDKVR